MRSWLLSALIASAGLAFVPAVRAAEEEPKPAQGPFVVIVGVNEFADKAIQPRPTAVADARALYDLFADKKYANIAPERLLLLTSTPDEKRKGQKATRENILKAVHEAVAKTGKDDTVILAFFGRGASSGERTAIFASDSTVKNRAKDSVLGSDLEVELKNAKDQRIAILMDLNFKGFDAGKETLVEPNLRDVLTGLYGGEEKGEQPAPHDKLLMLASVPIYEPLTKGDNGLFASSVLEALKGAADNEGYEPDGLVTVDELVKYVEKDMTDQARILGKTEKEKEAVPYIVGEEFSHFPITKNPKITASVEKRILALDKLAKDGQVSKELAAEGKTLLSRMPKLKAPQELRKKFQALTDGELKPAEFADAAKEIKSRMVLDAEASRSFAGKVFAAIELVNSKYVKKTELSDLTAAAITGLYRRLEEPLPSEIEAELKKSKEWDRDAMKAALANARIQLGKREDLEGNKDADIGITMMLGSLKDPYTTYYDKETIKKAESQLRGSFSGVGIQIRRDLVKDALLVVSPIKGSPAYLAGIQAGDLIVGIKRDSDPQGDPLPADAPKEYTTKGMKTEQALDIILGKQGVPITLVVQRGDEKPKDYTIKRGRVTVETVLGVKRDANDDWTFFMDDDQKIAYIHLTQFAPSTAGELFRTITTLQKAGMKGLVLDLRFNPGGVLGGAVAICDLFIKDGKIVTVRPRVGREDSYRDRDIAAFIDFPMAILVNGSSASASEIVAACMQDYSRAVIIGERSYGKGSVQQVDGFDPTEGQMKMTTARYFPPSDRNIDKLSTKGKDEDEWGVKPDKGFEMKLPRDEQRDLADAMRDLEIIPKKAGKPEEKKPFVDKQKDKALDYIREQLKAVKK